MSSIDTDEAARSFAVDPRNNVVLEASAGTGKTTVLVQRYVNLLRAGVEPANILAITFTRKAATEMRDRIVRELRSAAALSKPDKARWLSLRDRLTDIAISTIDAFCLSLLREFPLEADLDPGFDLADETEVPRFVEEALDRSMRIFRSLAREDADIALVIAQLGETRARAGLTSLLERRLVAWDALDRFLVTGPRHLKAADVCATAAGDLVAVLQHAPGGTAAWLEDGPVFHPRYRLFLREVQRLGRRQELTDAEVRAALDRVALHFLTQDGAPRKGHSIHPYNSSHYVNDAAARRHRVALQQMAVEVERIIRRFRTELNVVLARGVRRMFAIALEQYRKTLETRSALDFSDVLEHAVVLLRRMDEFSQSRFRLESRYHHVLVDEFQDTSRAQWELVALLVQSWGEGMGLAANPSVFIVGDRKQSIYRFRDAEVAVLQEAAQYIEGLRPEATARRSISRSFRAVPELLAFVNEVCGEMSAPATRPDSFTYRESDRFPPVAADRHSGGPAIGVSVAETPEVCAAAVADEIARVLRDDTVRDKETGVARAARPGDIAILFRSRTSHREFEQELARRAIPTYVYKGLGFFDSDEIKDLCALLRYLAQPSSNLRAAAFLRSGFVRLSDAALAVLSPEIAGAILDESAPTIALDAEDAAMLAQVRRCAPGWLELVDRVAPADLVERMLPELAYAYEIRGRREQQAWENLKKMRALIRRVQNRGYATLARIAEHVDALSAGEESNAVLEAVDAVNLMTVHASKGLEFPIVFVVNMARGASGLPRPIRVIVDGESDAPSVSIGPFVSEVDELERDRELHESRRLLYVALTRARDRLYLSTFLKEGRLVTGRGSLGEVLPATVKSMFENAASASGDVMQWRAASGRSFTVRICRPSAAEPGAGATRDRGPTLDLVGGVAATKLTHRTSVSEWLTVQRADDDLGSEQPSADRVLVGLLVHRLFQVASRQTDRPASDPRATVKALLTTEERLLVQDPTAIMGRAAAIWERLRERADVRELLDAPTVLAEVPFSLSLTEAERPTIVRGTIDCLTIDAAGDVTVVELKTGREQKAHIHQLALYVRAAKSLFPGRLVRSRLIYQN